MVTTEGYGYLGVKITPDLNNITSANYDPLLEKVTETLNHCPTLLISMTGRINLNKLK